MKKNWDVNPVFQIVVQYVVQYDSWGKYSEPNCALKFNWVW